MFHYIIKVISVLILCEGVNYEYYILNCTSIFRKSKKNYMRAIFNCLRRQQMISHYISNSNPSLGLCEHYFFNVFILPKKKLINAKPSTCFCRLFVLKPLINVTSHIDTGRTKNAMLEFSPQP